jgi:Tol biopolymer transport system component
LVYVPGPASISTDLQFNLALLDATGKIEVLKLPPRTYQSPRVSRDGKQIALGIGNDKGSDIWIYDVSGTSAVRRLTFGGKDRFPVWSADGRYVAFQSESEGDRAIFWQRADFSGTAERLTRPEPGISHVPESWLPQGDVAGLRK